MTSFFTLLSPGQLHLRARPRQRQVLVRKKMKTIEINEF
jgi:hypothetical protein